MEKRWYEFWGDWGLVPRLMATVGIAVVTGGVLQSGLLVVEGASDNSARLQRELGEVLQYLAPIVADQALVGDYAAIDQILKKQVTRSELDRLWWKDAGGRMLSADDRVDVSTAPSWFVKMVAIELPSHIGVDVVAGGVSYGTLYGKMHSVNSHNRLWQQFVKQLQIVVATLFLMLQFIWLIFRGNLGTLRELATGANRFSQGDHAVRIASAGAPEVRLAADAFNNMATNTETLLTSLGQSEAKNRLLASIVEQSSEAIWTTDLDGRVTSWNAGASAMFGYHAADVLGHVVNETGKGDRVAEKERMQRLIKLEKFSYDSRAATQSGGQIDIQVAVAPLLGDTGECVGKISVARDVTERNRNEEALRTARATAETASQAKSSFLARMSHEIRTPMNGVLGMTELLLETGLTSTQRKYAETVHRSGANLLGIINDVLDFSKIEAGKLELEHIELDVRRTLEDVVDMLAERAHVKGMELACSIPADLPPQLTGDPLRLRQVLTNLAGNAIKFTETGSVLISVSRVDETGERVTLRFGVKDTGPGISQEAQGRIFEEFSQADGSTTRQHGGSGLGLAISKQLVEMMQGRIQVESAPGAGSTFSFTAVFAKRPESSLARAGQAPLVQGVRLEGVRALIVESSAVSRGILPAQANGWHMVTRVAESLAQGLELLKQAATRGVPFDMVIVDMGFSPESPLAFARAIRADAALAKPRLVMLAPVGNHAIIQEAGAAGMDACLVKPVRQSALYDTLVGVMGGQTMAADAPGSAATNTPAAVVKSNRSVLLVEDNLVNQAVAMGMVHNLMGHNVTVANNGLEALELSANTPFDLILMDCHMPLMDGFEATREIRRREASSGGKRVPIVALTANAMAQDRADCLNAGMDDHLGKPFSRAQMQEMIDRWMPPESLEEALTRTGRIVRSRQLPVDVVLDRRVLRQLSDLQGADNPDLLARVLEIYALESPKEMASLAKAAAALDAAGITRSAHSLKSSSANIGATAMSQMCADMEAAGRGGDTEFARGLFTKLEVEHGRVQNAVKAELASMVPA
jgi:two-component system, sensor histidine kinase and response regulator